MTAVGSGIASQIVYLPETTYGVAPALTTNEALEFKSETLELRKTTVQGQGLHAGGRYDRRKRRVLTNYAVQGGIVMDLQTRFIGNLIQHMVGSFGFAGAVPAEIGATGIYKSVHWPNSPYLQGHSLCFQKGVPAVDGTVEPFTYVGCKISDWEISVATGALAQLVLTIDGRNELAGTGNSDPLNASVPALAAFNSTPGSGLDLSEFHFREATLYSGGTPTLTATTVTLTTPAVPASNTPVTNTTGQTAMVTVTGGTITSIKVNGTQVGTVDGTYAVPAGETVSITYSAAPTWQWYSGIVSLSGATALGNVQSASVKQTVSLDNARYFLGSNGFKAEQIENGFAQIGGQFVIEWLSSEAQYDAFSADTNTSLQLSLVGDTVSTSNYLLDIIIPSIKLDGESPKVNGPQVVTQACAFTGLDDESTTPIQIIYQTEDTTL